MPVTIVGNNTPTAGGVVYGDGTNYVSTAAGTSGQVLTSNGSGAPTWASATSGLTLVSTLTPANTTTTASVTGLSSYKSFTIITDAAVTLSTTGGLQFQLSANNGSSYGNAITFTQTNGSVPRGYTQIFRTDNASSNKPVLLLAQNASASVTNVTDVTGTINAIQISITTAATFTGTGTIYIYGMN